MPWPPLAFPEPVGPPVGPLPEPQEPQPPQPPPTPGFPQPGGAPPTAGFPEPDAARQGRERTRWVQSSLNQVLSLQLQVNGVLGPETRSAIRSFQERRGLPADGFLGPDTIQALVEARRSGAAPAGGAPVPASNGGPPPGAGGPPPGAGEPASAGAPPEAAGAGPAPSAGDQAPASEFWYRETAFPAGRPAMHTGHAPVPQLRDNIVRLARQEWQRWNAGGKKHERDPRMSAILLDYYRQGGGLQVNQADLRKPEFHDQHPWSAAFISWVMRQAGAGSAFPYSAGHAHYIFATKKNRQANNRNPFKAFRTTEVRPAPGDLVCRRRAGVPATYENIQPGMKTHCDIVVEARPGELITMGGNVSNSVGITKVPVDRRGFIADPRYFAVIKLGSPASP